jgi:predicted amidohydrolase
MKIAFLHLAPVPGEIPYNRSLVLRAVGVAESSGADWIITPELCICGYGFAADIGTEWILPQPDFWMTDLCRLAAQSRATLFLSHPERDSQTGRLHNSVFVIEANGTILGRHRKINVLPGSESWSSPGEDVTPILVDGTRVGVIICSDVCTPGIYKRLKMQGAQILISAASWGPGPYEPNGEWEQCTRDTGLPLLVCNRTGPDRTLSFVGAESVVVQEGRRILSFQSERSSVLTIEWDLESQTLIGGMDKAIGL